MAALQHAHRGAHPGADPLLDILVLPVSHDHLAHFFQTAENMSVLPVSVGCLVLVHKVHVNGVVGDLPVELGMEMEQRFPELLQSQYPGFRR